MSTADAPEIFLASRMSEAIRPLADHEYANAVALTARVARDQRLDRAQTIELIQMLGLDQSPLVQRVLDRRTDPEGRLA